jgi:hypothetical protein
MIVKVGDIFKFKVNVSFAEPLRSVGFDIDYPSHISPVTVTTSGSIVKVDSGDLFTGKQKELLANGSNGKVIVSSVLNPITQDADLPSLLGKKSVCTIYFSADSIGKGTIYLSNLQARDVQNMSVVPYDTEASNDLPVEVRGGTVAFDIEVVL